MPLTNEIFTAQSSAIKADGAHLFWTTNTNESLKESINEFGQTTPLLVADGENGLTLVAGHARLSVLIEADKPVLARMVTDATAIELGLIYLTDNSQRVLDDGMRLQALKYFSQHMDTKTLTADIMPRLGIKPKSKDAKLLITWLDMPATWQALLESGNIPLASATPLKRMSSEDLAAVEPLFLGFSWSRSNAVNVLNWLFETSKMADQTVEEVLESAGMTAIMKQGLSPKDAIAKLAAAAKLARYPELSALQNKFVAASSEITTGTRWRMSQPNNFETGGSELTIQVKDAAQLKKAVEELTTMADSSAWEKIWKLGGKNG